MRRGQLPAVDLAIVGEVDLARIGVLLGEHLQGQQEAVLRIELEAALHAAVEADQHVERLGWPGSGAVPR